MGPPVDLDAFGQRLRGARESRGLTLDQLSERAGLSKAHLSRLQSGERQASIGALVDLSTALGCASARCWARMTTVDHWKTAPAQCPPRGH